jgi:hypothetical protein
MKQNPRKLGRDRIKNSNGNLSSQANTDILPTWQRNRGEGRELGALVRATPGAFMYYSWFSL